MRLLASEEGLPSGGTPTRANHKPQGLIAREVRYSSERISPIQAHGDV